MRLKLSTPRSVSTPRRVAAIAAVVALHVVLYEIVNGINGSRPPEHLWNIAIAVDEWIPYLPWSWPLYWLTYPLLLWGGAAAALGLDSRPFRRALVAFAGMALIGAVVQLLIPARAPWPDVATATQELVHRSSLTGPYANLPSMRVAFCTLAAVIIHHVTARTAMRTLAWAAVPLIAVGTITIREHYALDIVTGALLAAGAAWWWRRPSAPKGPVGGNIPEGQA